MNVNHPQFRVVEEIPDDPLENERPPKPPSPARANPEEHAAAIAMIRIAFAALSQRAVAALGSMFILLTAASVFALWVLIPDPNTKQLVGMGMYAVFVLAVDWLFVWSRK